MSIAEITHPPDRNDAERVERSLAASSGRSDQRPLRPSNDPSDGPRTVGFVPRKEAVWQKCADTGRGTLAQPGIAEQSEPRSTKLLQAQMVASAVTENKRALELDSRLLLCERRSYGREHVHFMLAVRGLRQAFAEADKIPADIDHTAIEVNVLTAQREKLAGTEAREDQQREDRVFLSLCDREERFYFVERQRIDGRFAFAQFLDVGNRILRNQFPPLRRDKDRMQQTACHVDSARSE